MQEEPETGQLGEAQTSPRRAFLRQIGMTLAAGLGAVALPSLARGGNDRPDTFQCCPNSSCPSCSSGKPFLCVCPTGNYCTCIASNVCGLCPS